MYVTLMDNKPFKDFIDLVYDTTNTIKLVFTSKGLKISLLNNQHIAFYNAEYDVSFFESYDVAEDSELVFDSKDLFTILKSCNAKDELMIRWDNEPRVEFITESNSNRRIFEVGLVDELYDSPTPPDIPYDVDFLMSWENLKQCCTDLDNVVGTDRFIIKLDSNGCFVCSPNDSMTQYNNRISEESYDVTLKSIVNVMYLKGLLKLSKNGDLHLKLADGSPLSWSISNQMGDVEFSGLIAPILEDMG